VPVFLVTNKALATSLGVTSLPYIALVVAGERHQFTGALESKAINSVIKSAALPLLIDYDRDTEKLANVEENVSLLVVRVGTGATGQPRIDELALPLAKAFKGKVQVLTLNETVASNKDFRKDTGLDSSTAVLAWIPSKGFLNYPPADNPSAPLTVAGAQAWLDNCLSGKLKPPLKSQAEPTQEGPVFELVGSSYVPKTTAGKDVFVMHYLPWCQFCKKMKPVVKKLAEGFASQPSVIIAQINVEANDVPSSVEGDSFPSFYLWPAGESKPLPAPQDARTFKTLAEFIAKNSKTGAKAPEAPAKETKTKADL